MPYSPWGLKELDMTEATEHTHKEVKSIILRTGIRICLREETCVCVCVCVRERK